MSTDIKYYNKVSAYNVHSDWLKQHVLSENRPWVDDIKLAIKFLLLNFDKFDPN